MLEHDPFPDGPPLRIRTRRIHYRFTDAEVRARDDTVWALEPGADYCPALSLRDFERPSAQARGARRR